MRQPQGDEHPAAYCDEKEMMTLIDQASHDSQSCTFLKSSGS